MGLSGARPARDPVLGRPIDEEFVEVLPELKSIQIGSQKHSFRLNNPMFCVKEILLFLCIQRNRRFPNMVITFQHCVTCRKEILLHFSQLNSGMADIIYPEWCRTFAPQINQNKLCNYFGHSRPKWSLSYRFHGACDGVPCLSRRTRIRYGTCLLQPINSK